MAINLIQRDSVPQEKCLSDAHALQHVRLVSDGVRDSRKSDLQGYAAVAWGTQVRSASVVRPTPDGLTSLHRQRHKLIL
eukprot:g26005.t1